MNLNKLKTDHKNLLGQAASYPVDSDERISLMKAAEDVNIKIGLFDDFFQHDVKITEGRFGKYAKWENNTHPENPNFMQTVNWVADEMKENNTVAVKYYLDKTNIGDNHVVAILPINETFESTVFEWWANH